VPRSPDCRHINCGMHIEVTWRTLCSAVSRPEAKLHACPTPVSAAEGDRCRSNDVLPTVGVGRWAVYCTASGARRR